MKRLSVLLLFLYGCHNPCHSGHFAVEYTREHYTMHTTSHKIGDIEFETTTPRYHPAACTAYWYCDIRCKDVDTGKSEAHDPHVTLRSDPYVNDKCWFNGIEAQVKP